MEPIWNEFNMESVAGRSSAQLIVESDIPVPAGRNAERILLSQATIKNERSYCANGRIQAEGTLSLQMLCMDQENVPFGMRATTHYNHEIGMDSVKDGMRATIKPQLLDMRCSLRDRRIHLEAVTELKATVEYHENIRVLSDIAGVNDIQKQYIEKELGQCIPSGGSTLRLHEELPAEGVRQLLLTDAKAQVSSVTLEANGAIARGTLYVTGLYFGDENQYYKISQQLDFEELIPIELRADTGATIYVTPVVQDIAMALSENDGYIDMDAVISLDASCIGTTHVQALCDAYVPDGACRCKQETVERLSPILYAAQNCSIQENIRMPEEMPNALKPIIASAEPSILGITDHGGKLSFEGLLITSILYQTDEGILTGFQEDVPFNYTLDVPYMPDADVELNILEVQVSGGGRTVNCSFEMEARSLLRELTYISLAVDMEEAEPVKRENGIMVNFASAGETFWNIGKKYGLPIEQIRNWNPKAQEPFQEGEPILILSASGKSRRAK